MLARSPNRPRGTEAFVNVKTGQLSKEGLIVADEAWRQYSAGYPIVPCICSGTNALTLTPVLNSAAGDNYGNGMTFRAIAANTSTGAVTVAVGSLTGLPVYKADGATQAGNASIIAGQLYDFIYVSSLNSGNGGFFLSPVGIKSAGTNGFFFSYVPTVVASVGTFTSVAANGRFYQIDKLTFFALLIAITTNGTASGFIVSSVPVVAQNSWVPVVAGAAVSVSGKELQGWIIPNSTQIEIFNYDGTYPGASGENLVLSGCYEAL